MITIIPKFLRPTKTEVPRYSNGKPIPRSESNLAAIKYANKAIKRNIEQSIRKEVGYVVHGTLKGTPDIPSIILGVYTRPATMVKILHDRVSKLTTHKQKQFFNTLSKAIDKDEKQLKIHEFFEDITQSISKDQSFIKNMQKLRILAEKNGFDLTKLIK